MSFRFNFSGDEDNDSEIIKNDEIEWLKCDEIIPEKRIVDLDEKTIHARMITCRDIEIGHIVIEEALDNMPGDTLHASKLASNVKSDLVSGKYEGGLKIWECTYDLLEYLIDNKEVHHLKGIKVLDLGCGAGILGIYAFLNGSFVTFQDYNKEVLEYVTIPNVLLNIEEEENRKTEIKRCNFFSGDWASFDSTLDPTLAFDLILTSETIYNDKNYDKILKLFTKRLQKNGHIYVAAKTCYFGVGGGIRQFEEAIDKNGSLKCEVCWKITDGIQREILKITKKNY